MIEMYDSKKKELEKKDNLLTKKIKVSQSDIIRWGYESIWFGRRSMRYKTKPMEMINEL